MGKDSEASGVLGRLWTNAGIVCVRQYTKSCPHSMGNKSATDMLQAQKLLQPLTQANTFCDEKQCHNEEYKQTGCWWLNVGQNFEKL
jgi:hypothetical protein